MEVVEQMIKKILMRLEKEKILKWILKHGWYIALLTASSIYFIIYRFEIYDLKEINARNLLFLLWLVLLALPLFSEMEFFGIKVTKEIEKATESVRDSIKEIQSQINQMQTNNSIAANLNINAPMPTESKIEELMQRMQTLESTYSESNQTNRVSRIKNEDKHVFLFKMRLELEVSLRYLCEKIGYNNIMPMMRMVHLLNQAEIIDHITCELIEQIVKITNRGVHGELVSDEYIDFVKKSCPKVLQRLDEISSKLVYYNCSKCGFMGYSMYENVCPRCGYMQDID